jgi:hypothetical protein
MINLLILYMLELYPISFNKDKIYENKVRLTCYICLGVILLSFFIWFIFFSEPYKIYRSEKIDVIQYKL